MMFLVTQMLLCIVLALVTGGAVGWLAHRSRTADRHGELRQTIGRQHAQVQQARTDVAMVTQDYDDLKMKAQAEIDSLKSENKRLPSLHNNLEKSQTLVRQLMQKHEVQLRDLAQTNERLSTELGVLRDREAMHLRVRAELEALRSSHPSAAASMTPLLDRSGDDTMAPVMDSPNMDTPNEPGAAVVAEEPADDSAVSSDDHGDSTPVVDVDPAAPTSGRHPARSNWASASVPNVSEPQSGAEPVAACASGAEQHNVEPVESDSAALMRSMGLDIGNARPANPDTEDASRPVDADDMEDDGLANDESMVDEDPDEDDLDDDDLTVEDAVDEHLVGEMADARHDDSGDIEPDDLAAGEVDFDVPDDADSPADGDENHSRVDSERDITADMESDADALDDAVPLNPADDDFADGPADVEPLFDSVERRDDLKAIFGIGPVTERALNELGITSYSQLAELERHDIETIADALQIFPGRIERDDWVGNARRQLEDVLEEL